MTVLIFSAPICLEEAQQLESLREMIEQVCDTDTVEIDLSKMQSIKP
jgi:hypothetical protein